MTVLECLKACEEILTELTSDQGIQDGTWREIDSLLPELYRLQKEEVRETTTKALAHMMLDTIAISEAIDNGEATDKLIMELQGRISAVIGNDTDYTWEDYEEMVGE